MFIIVFIFLNWFTEQYSYSTIPKNVHTDLSQSYEFTVDIIGLDFPSLASSKYMYIKMRVSASCLVLFVN